MRSVLVAAAFGFLSLDLLAHETVQVSADLATVRSGPGTGYAQIGAVAVGQSYVAFATSGSWRKIWYGPGAGWISSSLLTATGAVYAKVTTSSLNVRTGPGTGYDVVGTAGEGSYWATVESSGAWQKIWFGGAARWVHGGYLSTGLSNPLALPTSKAKFVQLPASGTGYYSYASSSRRWGTPSLVYGLLNVASDWTVQHDWPAIGIGDISLKYGGDISGHLSHEVGKDVDVYPVRTDTTGPTTITSSTYSRARTKDLITHHVKPLMNVRVIFFNDSQIYNALSYVQYWSNHSNHFHVRIW